MDEKPQRHCLVQNVKISHAIRLSVWLLVIALVPIIVLADEQHQRWEELFFPFSIVGAPPQLEQQIQIFGTYFTGNAGQGFEPSAELAYILTAHLGLVATLPYQVGYSGQSTGWQDANLMVQYLATGSLEHDDMLSVGIQTSFPTGASSLTQGDYLIGPFAYAAKRFYKHLIFELNGTALFPIEHTDTAKQFLLNGLISYLTTPVDSKFPIYIQTELDSTFFVSGTQGLPQGMTTSPAQTFFIAPEIYFGPFKCSISDGTRIAAGVFFNVTGDAVHSHIYSLTIAFDLPNRFGY